MSANSTYAMQPVGRAISGVIRPPGSKSLTNRALVTAALAAGTSELTGVLQSRDTEVMIDSLRRLGISIEESTDEHRVVVQGCGGKIPNARADLWLENSGTSIRFLAAMCALGPGNGQPGNYRLDGNSRMRERPIDDLISALGAMGCQARCELNSGCPPVVIESTGLSASNVSIRAEKSSQFLSALLLASPYNQKPLQIETIGTMVSEPYVEMTSGVMAAFGVSVECPQPGTYIVKPATYQGIQYDIEPDASAASYFFAVAAITGGEVTVDGLNANALQGDVMFVKALEQMGCEVRWGERQITVKGQPLKGIEIDMNAISDTAQTLAVVATYAQSPTTIRNIAHVRHKETDRIQAVVTELNKLGIHAVEFEDGMTIHPGVPRCSESNPALVDTYDDHRMAMSFALLGLVHSGIVIDNPGCTSKTYPDFFADLARLCEESSSL